MSWFRRSVTLRTGLGPDDAIAGLKRVVRPGPTFSLDVGTDERPLRGRIEGRQFEVVRRSQFWNSFTPIGRGDVREADGGSEVTLTCSMHLVPLVALVVWLAVSIGVVVGLALSHALDGALGALVGILPVLGPLVGWALWRSELDALTADVTVGITRRDS